MQRSLSKKPINRLVKNQLSSLLIDESIKTTLPKAKMLKREAQELIGKLQSENNPLSLRKKAEQLLYGTAIKKFIDYKGKIKSVSLFKVGVRKGDSAQMAVVHLNMMKDETVKSERKGKEK